MDNSKKNVHSSGPLGMLIKNGQVKKIEGVEQSPVVNKELSTPQKSAGSYFKTQSGIEFSDQELVYVDPKECEPWQYANRQESELGDIAGLIDSIKVHKQLQPALIRNHPAPHDGIKYEVIFGRRRHLACSKLGIPFLAIRKAIPSIQDAIASQDAENKLRNDVSNYSNALLYKRLLLDGVFKSEKELADKLGLSSSTLNDLMAYAKIPESIVCDIPDIHHLSKQLAVKIVYLVNKSKGNTIKLAALAKQIGKSITSPAKLEQVLEIQTSNSSMRTTIANSKVYHSQYGEKLFTYRIDSRGQPYIVFNKEFLIQVDVEEACTHFSTYLEGLMSHGIHLE